MIELEYVRRKLCKCLYLYIAETNRCGLGMFTAKAFRAGEVVMIDDDGDYYERVLSYRDLCARGLDLDNTLQVGPDAFKLPTGSIDDFTNHCCAPNTGIRLNQRGTVIVALCDIAANEELTYDYSTYLDNPYERMACHCGAASCRRIVGNFSDLPESLRRHYLEWDVVGDFAARACARPPAAAR